ncbi:MAG: virulence factor SrfC family protein [Flavobacterium sp.]|uniref:virulence factor SrfC family protein n=1 Tax=Flavobacterium sp. TaxID=239 RepID=UPI003BE80E1A
MSSNNVIGKYIDIVDKSVQWVKAFEKGKKRSESFIDLKTQSIELRKLYQVIDRKPVITLFGASQVGKSYMADNLLNDDTNRFFVVNHQNKKPYNFKDEINPIGEGTEATGAITRFVSELESDIDLLPVKIKIFKPVDIICIIIDSVYNDFKETKNYPKPDKTQILAHLNQIENYIDKNVNQLFLSDNDIISIKQYLHSFSSNTVAFLKDLDTLEFWEKVGENIQYIPPKAWSSIFNILWYSSEEMNSILEESLGLMEQLNFEFELNIDFAPLLRINKDEKDKYIPVINVDCFKYFFDKDVKKTVVQTKQKNLIEVNNSILGYLTQEIVLTVSDSTILNKPFIKNIEILDFPGARSRGEFTNFSDKVEMLKRGKIAYLFNKYSDNYQASILAVCFRSVVQSNVRTVPAILNNWINKNIGETEEMRDNFIQNNLPPLFIVSTWWNKMLEYNSNSIVIIERLSNYFTYRFDEEIFKGFDWINNWQKKNNVFNNFYLLRSATEQFSGSFFKYDSSGNEILDLSNAYVSDRTKGFIEQIKQEFVRLNESYKYFSNPNKSFDEASLPGKDGSAWIIENLLKRANSKFTLPLFINKTNDAVNNVNNILRPKFRSGGADEAIKKNHRHSLDLRLNLNVNFEKNPYLFGQFIQQFLVSESKIFEFYHDLLQSNLLIKKQELNKYILLRVDNPSINLNLSFEENIELLRQRYRYDTSEQVIEYFNNNDIDLNQLFFGDLHNLQNNSLILAEKAMEYWFNEKLTIENFDDFKKYNLNQNLLNELFDVLKTLFKDKLKLQDYISMLIRQFVDGQIKIDKAEDMIAHITAGVINKFVTSSGWEFFDQDRKDEIKATSEINQLNLIFPDDNSNKIEFVVSNQKSDALSIEEVLEYMENLNSNLNQKTIDDKMKKMVPMISNFQRWLNLMEIAFITTCDIPNYDINANNKLGEILKEFDSLDALN